MTVDGCQSIPTLEIVVDDPTAPEDDSPAVTSNRTVEIAVSLLLLALAATLGWDNWRTGIGWDSTGPQAGYFPFYLSVILAGASLYGLIATIAVARRRGRNLRDARRSFAASWRCSCRRCCSACSRSSSGSMSRASC